MQGLEVLKSESVSMLDCNKSQVNKDQRELTKVFMAPVSLCPASLRPVEPLIYPSHACSCAPPSRRRPLHTPSQSCPTWPCLLHSPLFSLPLPASLVHSCNTPQTVLLVLFLSRHDRILLLISFISMLFQSYLLP